MPNPADILSLQNDEDPDDALRMQLDQGQGNNLAGGPNQAGMAPSPNVPGPLAALAPKPKIKLKAPAPGVKPHIKLKNTSLPPKVKKIKPKIRPKPGPSSALQNFLAAIGPNPGS